MMTLTGVCSDQRLCLRSRVLIDAAAAAEVCEDEDDEGALRCGQNSGVLLQKDVAL